MAMEDFLNQDFSKPKEEENEAKGEEEKDAEEDLDFRYYAGVSYIDQELVNRVYTPEKQEEIERIGTEKRERLQNAFRKLHIEGLRKKWQFLAGDEVLSLQNEVIRQLFYIKSKGRDKMKFVIIDIDNTICKKYPDRAFDELDKVHLDTPITPVVRVLEALCNHDDVFPIFITARLESSRKVTVKWLRENTELVYTYDLESNLYMKPEIPPSDLKILNELGMTRRDSMVKRYLLKKFLEKSWITKEAILGVFDDNQECNKMWREEGLFVFDVNQDK